jgi:hypothetical protein
MLILIWCLAGASPAIILATQHPSCHVTNSRSQLLCQQCKRPPSSMTWREGGTVSLIARGSTPAGGDSMLVQGKAGTCAPRLGGARRTSVQWLLDGLRAAGVLIRDCCALVVPWVCTRGSRPHGTVRGLQTHKHRSGRCSEAQTCGLLACLQALQRSWLRWVVRRPISLGHSGREEGRHRPAQQPRRSSPAGVHRRRPLCEFWKKVDRGVDAFKAIIIGMYIVIVMDLITSSHQNASSRRF